MQRFDINCPAHKACGIKGGVIASLPSAFYNDPYEGDEELAQQLNRCAGAGGYRLALTINPALPGWQDDIAKGRRELGAACVRIYPAYHGYALSDIAAELCTVLRGQRMPLLVGARLEDDRLRHMLAFSAISAQDVEALMKAAEDDVGVALLGMHRSELEKCLPVFRQHQNLFADICWLKEETDCLERAAEAFGADRLLLGTLYPLLAMESTLGVLEDADLPENAVTDIAGKNAADFLKKYCG